MKLISLNIWGGCLTQPLLYFFSKHIDIDIFCIQEVYHKAEKRISTDSNHVCLSILEKIMRILPNHNFWFEPVVGQYGLAIIYKKELRPINKEISQIYHNPNYCGQGPAHSRILQSIQFNDLAARVINVHGLWNGQGKGDSPERINQSISIKNVLEENSLPYLLCGDFNFSPGTQSHQILSAISRDHIIENDIASTRTFLYEKSVRHADYIFTSKNLKVENFKILPDEVSDHAPLYCDFFN